MKKHRQSANALPIAALRQRSAGFSLIELMVAMTIFLIVGGAAVNLISKHEALFTSSQNQTGVNISLRNAVAQIQTDVVNAGSGYYPGSSMPFWPVGITTKMAATPNCNTQAAPVVYVQTCFDQLTVLTADPSMPSAQPSADQAGTLAFTIASPDLYLTFPTTPAPTPAMLTLWAATFAPGNEILLVTGNNSNPIMAPLVIQSQGGAVGAVVTGTTLHLLVTPASPGSPDPLGIYDNNLSDANQFAAVGTAASGTTFGPAKDYAIRLDATVYFVNNSNQLIRQVGIAAGAPQDAIAENVVGFNLQEFANGGWTTLTSGADWTKIRAVYAQIVLRAPSQSNVGSGYKNSYDQGAYQVQGMSMVINPRNLSMNN
jgi:prepilin-type N-terminal cleavage/methylation domain-containing protein